MLFPTTFIVALLAIVTPTFSAPIPDVVSGLVTRSESAPLEARGLDIELPMEMTKRDDEFYENLAARDDELYEELMARAPEPEMEDMERRGKIGMALNVFKKVEGLFHHSNNNNQQQQQHKRSIGNGSSLTPRSGAYVSELEARNFELEARSKVGNFFKKVGQGLKKAVGFAASIL